MNEHVITDAPVHTARIMTPEAPQPSGALVLSDTTLADWHKRHCLIDPVCRAYPMFHETVTINHYKSKPGANPVKSKASTDSHLEDGR